jgi:hypothetical protein
LLVARFVLWSFVIEPTEGIGRDVCEPRAMDHGTLEDRSDELFEAMADPYVEFEIGEFENGGVRLIVEWLDAGRGVPRSRAIGLFAERVEPVKGPQPTFNWNVAL